MPRLANSTARPRLAAWGVGLWLLLALDVYAGVQYLRFQAYVQLGLSLGLLIACVGCILRQAWAWRPLRWLLLGLVGWLSWSLAHLAGQWSRFGEARKSLQAAGSVALREQAEAMLRRLERVFAINLGLELLLLLGAIWLFVCLGRPAVKAQFLSRAQLRARQGQTPR